MLNKNIILRARAVVKRLVSTFGKIHNLFTFYTG